MMLPKSLYSRANIINAHSKTSIGRTIQPPPLCKRPSTLNCQSCVEASRTILGPQIYVRALHKPVVDITNSYTATCSVRSILLLKLAAMRGAIRKAIALPRRCKKTDAPVQSAHLFSPILARTRTCQLVSPTSCLLSIVAPFMHE